MRFLHRVVPVVAAVLALAGVTAGVASAHERGVAAFAAMDGAQEVPGPGDPDGYGFAHVSIFKDRVCAKIRVFRIDTPTAAHIHRGPAGVAGPVVVTLPTPTSGESEGCVNVDGALAQELADDPSEFYVNVHNAEFPDGAVRGQLEREDTHGA